jgi:hypothetical protein
MNLICDKSLFLAHNKNVGSTAAGIYNVRVYNGGNAVCGPGANASISSKYE